MGLILILPLVGWEFRLKLANLEIAPHWLVMARLFFHGIQRAGINVTGFWKNGINIFKKGSAIGWLHSDWLYITKRLISQAPHMFFDPFFNKNKILNFYYILKLCICIVRFLMTNYQQIKNFAILYRHTFRWPYLFYFLYCIDLGG